MDLLEFVDDLLGGPAQAVQHRLDSPRLLVAQPVVGVDHADAGPGQVVVELAGWNLGIDQALHGECVGDSAHQIRVADLR